MSAKAKAKAAAAWNKALAGTPLPRGLDIPERQALVLDESAHPKWKHVILFHRQKESIWIAGTPELEIESADLAECDDFRSLGRMSQIPPGCRPVLMFPTITTQELQTLRSEARETSEMLGTQTATEPVSKDDGVWVYSDSAVDLFGQEVPLRLLARSDQCTMHGAAGMVYQADGTPPAWTFMEKVAPADRTEWLSDKRVGAGRDSRLGSAPKTKGQCRVLLAVAFAHMMSMIKTADWPYSGPSALVELMKSMIASGYEPPFYYTHWRSTSGVSHGSGVCIEMGHWIHLLWLLICYDVLDVTNVAGAEMAARRILQIQKAVAKNPKAPDFSGLEHYMACALDPAGGVTASEFETHISKIQLGQSVIMRQNRLLRDEIASDNRRGPNQTGPKDPKAKAKGKKDRADADDQDGGG